MFDMDYVVGTMVWTVCCGRGGVDYGVEGGGVMQEEWHGMESYDLSNLTLKFI